MTADAGALAGGVERVLTPEEVAELELLEFAAQQEPTKPSLPPGCSSKEEVPSPVAPLEDTEQSLQDVLDQCKASPEGLHILPFEDPMELLCTAYEHVKPHKWQEEVSQILAGKAVGRPTAEHPLKMLLPAANGSGKDQFVICAFAVWFLCTRLHGTVVITSSSFEQLKRQTEKHIKDLCLALNRLNGKRLFRMVHFHIVCEATGSEIVMFATDEPGRAEGYHPDNKYPGAEMAIIVNEAKTVTDGIFSAFDRCTGYNYWIEVSSPGVAKGHFYRVCSLAEHVHPAKPVLGEYWLRKITAYDCPHIPLSHIRAKEKECGGKHSPWFRSSILAEFTTVDIAGLIPMHVVETAFATQKPQMGKRLICGIDIALGGDETTLSMFRGNTQIALEAFRNEDYNATATRIEHVLLANGFKRGVSWDQDIVADNGGIGKPIIQVLRERGWCIEGFNAQGAAHDSKRFGNIGFEIWQHMSAVIGKINWLPDDKLKEQLWSRQYEERSRGKYYLEAKSKVRGRGEGSPDRADASIMAWKNEWITLRDTEVPVTDEVTEAIVPPTARPLSEIMEQLRRPVEQKPQTKPLPVAFTQRMLYGEQQTQSPRGLFGCCLKSLWPSRR